MKYTILLILFFTSFATWGQIPFALNKKYNQWDVVVYPAGVFWRAKKTFTAGSYPAENAYWSRFYYDSQIPASISKSGYDSLLNRISLLEKSNAKLDAVVSSLNNTRTTPQPGQPVNSSFEYPLSGTQLFKVINDSLFRLRPIIFDDKDFNTNETDSAIIVNIKR